MTERFFKEDTKFMKCNKSYILLISLISIFILLGLNAVSATDDMNNQLLADNSAQDSVIGGNDDIDNNMNGVKDLSQGKNTEYYTSSGSGDDNFVGENNEDYITGSSSGEDNLAEDPSDTTIESENGTFKYGEDIKINVSVKDNENNTINITKDNLEVLENDNKLDFTLDNESRIVLNQLPIGEHILNIKFLANGTYLESETTSNITVVPSATTIEASDLNVKVGYDIIISLLIKDEFNNTVGFKKENIIIYCDEEEINFTLTNSGINLTGLKEKENYASGAVYTINITYSGNENYTGSEKNITVTILANNTINTNDTFNVNNHTKNVTVPISVTNTNINGTNVTVTTLNLTKDDIKLILEYNNGTDNISDEINEFNLTGENGTYTINFNTAKLNNSKLTIIYADGTINETNKTVTLKGVIGAYIVPINVKVDYQSGEFKFQVLDSVTNLPLKNTIIKVGGVIFHTFTDGSSMSPSKEFTTDNNGYIVIKNINLFNTYDFTGALYNFTSLPVGKYNLSFKSSDDSLVLDDKSEITVNKVKAKIIAANLVGEFGNVLTYSFKLVNAKTNEVIKLANVQFRINSSNIDAVRNGTTNMSGIYTSPSLNLYAGNYSIILRSLSSNVDCDSVKKTLTVNKRVATLTASNRNILYGSAPIAIVKVTDKKTGKVLANAYVLIRVYVNAKKTTNFAVMTDSKGYARLITKLAIGKHKMFISVLDNNFKSSTLKRYVNIKKTSGKFSASKVSTYYKSGKLFKIKLTNSKNKAAMYGASMNIKVFISKNKYYNYTGATSANGLVQFKIQYKPGTYKVVVSSNDKGYSAKSITRQIKVSKSPIKISPKSLKVKKGKYFKVKVTSKKSKKLLSGVKVKVKVYTAKKFKTYTIKTNKKGIASLKIRQKVGKHKVVLSPSSTNYYKASTVSKTLKVTK
ncbi:hypothetical protein SAMN02910297_00522 [Methanobrevibacter olleyae]|uniref:Adhesin-like protein n=2 Tax=Methanobrevibacter olleyae TaxID=294671 RepID=A0A1I4GMB0_METOL|nr:hypothetical protein SAMN02910297_00522 [Methanobrevibacter olleyae]